MVKSLRGAEDQYFKRGGGLEDGGESEERQSKVVGRTNADEGGLIELMAKVCSKKHVQFPRAR